MNENNGDELTTLSTHSSQSLRRRMRSMIKGFMCLKGAISNAVRYHLVYKLYVPGRGQFMYTKNSRESFNSNQTKALRRTGMFLVLLLPMKRTSTKMKKSIQEMIDRYGRKTHNVANNSGEHTLCRLLIIFHRALE